MSESLDLQENNKRLPATGFHTNPERINRKGRPKLGVSWADVVREVSDEINPETGVARKELIVRKLFKEALGGDMGAMRILWNSVVGNRILLEGNLDVSGDRLEAVIDELLAGRNNNDTEVN